MPVPVPSKSARRLCKHEQAFPAAEILEGFDIDEYAVRSGNAWLAAHRSKVRLLSGDMSAMEAMLEPGQAYDIAGKGVADAGSLIAAARVAVQLAGSEKR